MAFPWKHEIVTQDGRVITVSDERIACWDGRSASTVGRYDTQTLRDFQLSQVLVVPEGTKVDDCSKQVGWSGPSYDPDPVIRYTWPVGTLFVSSEHIVSYRKISADVPDSVVFVPRLPTRRSVKEFFFGGS